VHQNGTRQQQCPAARSAAQPAARPAERRGAVRHAHTEAVNMTTQWGTLAGSLLDLSASGVQVRLTNGLVPLEGDDVTLRLVDGRHLSGSVAWIGRDTVGVGLDHPLPSVEDLLWLEQRGPDWFYGSVRARQ
jgi:hypothetical protein